MSKPRGARRDAYRLPRKTDVSALFPFLMKRRCDSCVYYTVRIDVEPLFECIERRKAQGEEFTFFPFTVAAVVKLLQEREGMNRYVMGRNLYQREDVTVGFVTKRDFTDEAEEMVVKAIFKKGTRFDEVINKLKVRVKAIKEEGEPEDSFLVWMMGLPRFFLRLVVRFLWWLDFHGKLFSDLEKIDPLRCSVFLANLGSIGIEAPYHHLFEWGTCSIFAAIGRIQKMPVVVGDEIVLKTMVEVQVTLDERIADGFYFARSLDILKGYFEDPDKMIDEMNAQADNMTDKDARSADEHALDAETLTSA